MHLAPPAHGLQPGNQGHNERKIQPAMHVRPSGPWPSTGELKEKKKHHSDFNCSSDLGMIIPGRLVPPQRFVHDERCRRGRPLSRIDSRGAPARSRPRALSVQEVPGETNPEKVNALMAAPVHHWSGNANCAGETTSSPHQRSSRSRLNAPLPAPILERGDLAARLQSLV